MMSIRCLYNCKLTCHWICDYETLHCWYPYSQAVRYRRDLDELMAKYQNIIRQLQSAQKALKTELLAALKAPSGGDA